MPKKMWQTCYINQVLKCVPYENCCSPLEILVNPLSEPRVFVFILNLLLNSSI